MLQYEHGEEVIRYVRKHWLIFVLECFFVSFLALIPIFFYIFIPDSFSADVTSKIDGNSTVLFMFFYLLWLVVLWVVLFFIWTDYYLDVWIITNQRIIDIEQKGFFNREISSLRLDRIQDITINSSGFIATMFRFGSITVETAGTERNFLIPNAQNCEEVKQTILDQYAKVTAHLDPNRTI